MHDILDYTILKKEGKKFLPQNSIFDIRDAIKTIEEIKEDKSAMKNIEMSTIYTGFEDEEYMFNTD